MVLADAKDVEANAVGGLDLVEKSGHSLGGRRRSTRRRIGKDGRETVDTDFHGVSLYSSGFTAARPLWNGARSRYI